MGNALITRKGGGKPEGMYVWKKNSLNTVEKATSTNATTKLSDATNATITYYTSSSYTFDEATGLFALDNPTEATLPYGSSKSMSNNIYFIVGSPSGETMFKGTSNDTSRLTQLRNNSNGLFVEPYSSSYTYTVYTAEQEATFLDYVVSDKETAYPDGGEKGGYWYEKISNLKFTFGTFTPTSNQKETTIVHGLNDKIRFFGIYTEHIKPTENSLYQVEALSLHRGITYASNGTSTENYNGRVSTTYVLTSGPYWYDQGFKISSLYGIGDVTESSITIFKNNHATNDTSSGSTDAPYFIGGRVHKWIAIADWEV